MNAHLLLKHYHDECLVPDQNELSQIQSRVDSIINSFKASAYFNPMEVFIAGSYKKKTMLADRGEADLEFFYRNRTLDFPSVRREAKRILQANFPEAEIEESDNAVTIYFSYKNNEISIDIVVGYPVNSPKQMAQVSSSRKYTVTTGRIHVEYVNVQKDKYPLYQSTVRLVKDWRDACGLHLKSLHIELIVSSLFADWDIEPMEYPEILHSFFRHLTSVCDGATVILPVNWNLFGEDDITAKCTKTHVMIVDPANPSDNLADSLSVEDITEIKSSATRAIHLIDHNQWAELFDAEIIDQWQDKLSTR